MLIKPGHTTIICEMSQTYEGSFEVAKTLVQAAVAAGADAIKFQVFNADELATKDYLHYKLFQKLELSAKQWGELIKLAHAGGIMALADVFGIMSAKMLLEQGIDGYKIHSTDVKNIPLLEWLGATGKSLLLSTGGSQIDEVAKAISLLQNKDAKEIVLMHGFQSYPTLVEDTNLNKMKALQGRFHLPVGFADHIDGDHPARYDLCIMAMGLGVQLLEKHITSDRSLKMEDYESALNPADFKQFVARIRLLQTAFGPEKLDLSKAELAYRQVTKKHLVAARDLPTGTVLAPTDIAMKRTTETYEFLNQEAILGKKTKQPVVRDAVIRLEVLL